MYEWNKWDVWERQIEHMYPILAVPQCFGTLGLWIEVHCGPSALCLCGQIKMTSWHFYCKTHLWGFIVVVFSPSKVSLSGPRAYCLCQHILNVYAVYLTHLSSIWSYLTLSLCARVCPIPGYCVTDDSYSKVDEYRTHLRFHIWKYQYVTSDNEFFYFFIFIFSLICISNAFNLSGLKDHFTGWYLCILL